MYDRDFETYEFISFHLIYIFFNFEITTQLCFYQNILLLH